MKKFIGIEHLPTGYAVTIISEDEYGVQDRDFDLWRYPTKRMAEFRRDEIIEEEIDALVDEFDSTRYERGIPADGNEYDEALEKFLESRIDY